MIYPSEGTLCIVRTRDAGVHAGILLGPPEGQHVQLTDARRIWRWAGANTLNELSQTGGADEWTRISEPVPHIVLLDAIEVIPCAEAARESLTTSRWPG